VAEEVPDFSSGPSDATDPRRKVLLYRNKENDNVDAASRVGVFQTLTEGDDLVVGAEKMERPGAEHRFEKSPGADVPVANEQGDEEDLNNGLCRASADLDGH